jgi:hypothetical protein
MVLFCLSVLAVYFQLYHSVVLARGCVWELSYVAAPISIWKLTISAEIEIQIILEITPQFGNYGQIHAPQTSLERKPTRSSLALPNTCTETEKRRHHGEARRF